MIFRFYPRSFADIKIMSLFDDKNSDLILEIKAHSTTYKHTYRIGDKNQILNFLSKDLGSKLDIK